MNVPELRFPEFIGEWEEKKLGDLSKIQRGASPRPINSKKWYDQDVKNVGWVRISDVTKSNKILFNTKDYFSNEGIKKSRFLPKGSLIMSICATIGKPIVTGIDTCIHDGFVGFSNLNGVDKEFLYYNLSILENKFHSLGQTGSQANLNSDLVRITKIKIPSLEEQTKIVYFLSKVDEKIEKLEKKQELWETYKKGIMQQMFSQELRFYDENGEDYPDWEEKKIEKILEIKYGKDYKHLNEGNIPVYGTGGLMAYVDGYLYDKESVLIGRKGTISKPFYVNNPFWTVDTLFYTKIFGADAKFTYYLASTINWLKYNEASGVPSLSANNIKNIKVNIPSRQEQEKIASLLSYIDVKIGKTKKEAEINKKFKKGLLQHMFC